jgi:hypothetical protein
MPKLRLRSLVPTSPENLFEYITAHPAQGEADQERLERRYGRLVEHMGHIYRFEDQSPEKTLWQLGFDPPHRRSMQAIDSNWSDRTDEFEDADGWTRWTVTWELKSSGPTSITQWLAFQLVRKRQIYRQMMIPVLERFQSRPEGAPPGEYQPNDDSPQGDPPEGNLPDQKNPGGDPSDKEGPGFY